MGDVLGLGLTHYPTLCGPDDGMAVLLSMTLADPDLPAALADPTSWPDAMRSEWGDDRGATAAVSHRAELVSALSRVRAALDEFRPDAVVILGDDQYDNFREDIIPPFAVLAYDRVVARPWSKEEAAGGPLSAANIWGEPADIEFEVACHRDAALHLATSILELGVDVAYAYEPLHHRSLSHAFINTVLFLDYGRVGFDYPIVPIPINCYGRRVVSFHGRPSPLGVRRVLDPPSPSPQRMMQVGRALARAARDSPWRVAIVASSSWSHAFLCDKHHHLRPDTEADVRLYDAFITGDFKVWESTALEDVEQSGQQELLTWFALVGAMQELGADLSWSTLVTTDVFNSNKVFAVFDPVGRSTA